jgi:hypothetical protein
MGNLNEFFRDLGRNAYGLGENVASLGSAAIAEPVAGFAAMYDPANGAQAIREGMTYTPRTQAGQMYQQGAARTLGTIAQPAMPVIDTWQRGVDIAGGYSPVAGAMLRTVPTAIGVAMGAKPALQAGRQVSGSLGAMQGRMIANANAPRTLNAGYMGQRGAIGTQRPLTEFEQAHLLAQQRAALPVNQRGLDLPADNTAMDRARAMGWDTDVYHGSAFDIENIDTSRSPFYTTEGGAPHEIEFANNFANTKSEMGSPKVYPLLLKKGQITDTRKGIPEGLQNAAEDSYAPLNIGGKGLPTWGNVNSWARRAKANGEKGVLLDERPYLNSVAVLEPSMVRSRFAAFDPFNRDSSNLLAQSAKFAPAATLGALMANEKRKDKRN